MKRLIIFFFVSLILIFSISVVNASVASGAVNSSALNYFSTIVADLPDNVDYFLFKSGDYTTTLIYGDLDLVGSRIVGTDSIQLIYNSRDYQSTTAYYPSIMKSQLTSVSINTSKFSMAYSNLGDWSRIPRNSHTEVNYLLYVLIFAVFLYVFFKFRKNRRSYIDL